MEANPHALDTAQDPNEVFEIMEPPPNNFDPYVDAPVSTGTFTSRGVCHEQGLWHCSVHIWIVDTASSSILLQKRSMKKDTFPGRWDISSAGHVEKGKSLLETAQCELAEELGITVDTGDLKFAFIIPAEQTPLGGCNAFEHVYFLHGNSETSLSLGVEEVSGVSWVSASKLLAALAKGDDNYAPRTEQYCRAMGSFLEKMLNSH
ncbi:hypothetical protein ACHAWT_003839 [Skeletonema menzelii]